jgi:hypothetical protein
LKLLSSYLCLFLVLCAARPASAQLSLISQKGTKLSVDSSKWSLSGTNIINKNTGNIGLGNSSPIYKLDVTGKLRTSDSLVANTVRVLTLPSGTVSDSLVAADPATGVLKRISSARLNRPDSTTASNGLTLTGDDVRLGGALTSATSITTSTVNTLALAGLQSGSLSDSVVVASATTGIVKRISTEQFNKPDSTTASNGLTLSGNDVKLGGTLSGATTIATSAANTLAITGLQVGAVTDSILVVSPATGVLKWVDQNKPVVVKTTTTQASSSTTLATVNTLSFTAQAGKNYHITLWLLYSTVSTGTGIKLGPNTFGGTGNFWYSVSVNTGATSSQQLSGFNTNTAIISTNSRATTGNVAWITMDLECTTSGVMSFQFASESAGNAITIQPNSRLEYQVSN